MLLGFQDADFEDMALDECDAVGQAIFGASSSDEEDYFAGTGNEPAREVSEGTRRGCQDNVGVGAVVRVGPSTPGAEAIAQEAPSEAGAKADPTSGVAQVVPEPQIVEGGSKPASKASDLVRLG